MFLAILPFGLFYSIRKNNKKNKLQSYKIKYSLGFLFLTYKNNMYYWELVSTFFKSMVAVIINIYYE